MRPVFKLTLILVVLIAVGLKVDYYFVAQKEKRLSAAVSNIGGRVGSIPAWPLGTEYRITLTKAPTDEELAQLAVANTMRGWVGIVFQDCEISSRDRGRLNASLSSCHLFVAKDGKLSSLDRDEP
ncbi:hypothetical protein GC197_12495 [bacterium]|nr:hypothetical protein [bacterium]